ncbi:aldose epimerase family protein [Clostridium sp. Marseille-P299]|uniref:aldose epimerase family protein n=1 Tax=Clostridium sp. Marseille-P299 TaxID=1805477 RepID=UPI00082A9612|nr:aldose epimerase family protein [Clostridium sp. Marseille-P299]
MSISNKQFGKTNNGERASLYTLSNKNGMRVVVSDFGANIVSILVPDKKGVIKDVVLGYDNIEQYEVNSPGYGSFIGRHANRIGNATFQLNGTTYELEKNDGKNNLHSGSKSYNKFMYDVEIYEEDGENQIEFSRFSKELEQGFPGNLEVTVSYTLTDDNELVIEYYAISDKDTIVNFTNHSYFNLAGHDSGSILNHKLMIDSDKFTPTDDALIPTGEVLDVTGTPMDFRTPKTIGKDIEIDYLPLKQAGGYDHNYVLKTTREEAVKVAELFEEQTGRLMEIYTDMPGMQLYTGNFIEGKEKGKNNYVYKKRDGVCFETQFFPNSCNIHEFPSCVIKAGEEFDSVTIYKFSVR